MNQFLAKAAKWRSYLLHLIFQRNPKSVEPPELAPDVFSWLKNSAKICYDTATHENRPGSSSGAETGLAESPLPFQSRFPLYQVADLRSAADNRLRGGPMPESVGMLERRNGHVYDRRGTLHTCVRFLRS